MQRSPRLFDPGTIRQERRIVSPPCSAKNFSLWPRVGFSPSPFSRASKYKQYDDFTTVACTAILGYYGEAGRRDPLLSLRKM